MTSYRYLFCDIATNTIQAELDMTGVNFTKQLNAAGSLSANILLTGLPVGSNAMNATTPGLNGVYVDRNGVIVWGGIIWSRTYNSTTQNIQIQASEWESYFSRRRITSTLSFYQTDPLVIAKQLVSAAQSVPYGNIGIQVGNETSSQLVSRTFYGYENKPYLSALQDLAKSGSGASGTTGFDFYINCSYNGSGAIQKNLVLGYPRVGNVYSSTSTSVPVFEMPGNVVEYEYPEDGSQVANTVFVTGAGSNEGKLVYSATDSTKLIAGWPLLEDSVSYSDITDTTVLQGLANSQVAAVSYPPTVLKIISTASDPVLGSYIVGDDARVRIQDARWPNGLDATYRITGLTVTPGESGPERVTLTLSLPTS